MQEHEGSNYKTHIKPGLGKGAEAVKTKNIIHCKPYLQTQFKLALLQIKICNLCKKKPIGRPNATGLKKSTIWAKLMNLYLDLTPLVFIKGLETFPVRGVLCYASEFLGETEYSAFEKTRNRRNANIRETSFLVAN